MSVLEKNKIDFIGIDKQSQAVILTITDHLDWEDSNFHLLTLQEKINAYLIYYESGQIFEDYPAAKGRKIMIDIIQAEPFNSEGVAYFEEARAFIKTSLGIELRHRILP